MDSEPAGKCQEIDCVDRISNLPDPILGEILYFLPTKDAVATSVLSTRWKTLFPRALNRIKIDLDDCSRLTETTQKESKSPSFVSFVDKLFNETLIDVPCIERISINCEKDHGDMKIISWVRAAVRLKAVYLKLTADIEQTRPLFKCLNGCATLVEFDFWNENQLLLLEEEFILPNLKKLSLHECIPREYTYSIHELIDGCPLLEELNLGGCRYDGMTYIFIVSSTLKRLFIENSYRESDTKFKIDTPNLEAFVYEGQYIQNCAVGNFKSLNSALLDFRFFEYYPSSSDEDYASIDFDYAYLFGFSHEGDRSVSASTINRVVKLIRACSTTIRLGFAGSSIEALQGATIKLPVFKNLNCLALGRMGSDGFQIVAQLLKKAPILETLTFEEGFNKKIEGGYAIFESSLPKMPICLKHCFKKLVLWDFKGTEDEIKLIEYFCKNGRALQEVIVYHGPAVDTSILNRLLLLPKHSQTCQILTRSADHDMELRNSRYARKMWF